ncbi:Heparinase II/III-like protein [Aliicoccus persicus]|uniref:Heparinase II/III-like protein n=2 Tax=Aliicoccus persicus TaxID=930138 RepID=A0A662Z1G6_9STAP|nr:Heparinase II/III-like protein [Aliicoccus persicus]
MNQIIEKQMSNHLLKFERMTPNLYERNQSILLLEQAAENYDCTIEKQKISKSIYRSYIKYQDNIIGFLNGVRPGTTHEVAYKISKNFGYVKEYLRHQELNVDKELNSYFKIRVVFIEGRYISSTLLLPSYVVGNGVDRIEKLLDRKNEFRRSNNYLKRHSVKKDNDLQQHLKTNQKSLLTVLENDEILLLNDSYELTKGAETIDITDDISSDIIEKSRQIIASIPGLYSAGLDLITDDYNSPKDITLESLITSPGSLVTYLPFKGESINIYDAYIESLMIRYKKLNNLPLEEKESDILKEFEEYEDLKKQYYEYAKKNIINNDRVSGKLCLILRGFNNETLSNESKNRRDSAKKNLIVDHVLFKPEENKPFNINSYNVLRLIRARKDNSEIAIKAMNNEIVPFPKFDSVFFDKYYYLTDKTKKYGASYQLYIQSLRVVGVLLTEYEKNKDLGLLYKAEELIYEWISFVSNGTNEPMVWYDHPTANRTQVLIQFIYLAEEAGFDIDYGLFRSVLKKHSEILRSDEKYNNNNHGLMMDKALMALGLILDDDKIFMKGYYRSIDTFWYSYSSQGTHLENSPDYHSMVLRMYTELQKYLMDNNHTYNDNILKVLELAKGYHSVIMKPNLLLPPVGDSGNSRNYSKKKYENFYDLESGMAVLQYESEKPFYVNFICGYSSKTHKHKDDLSINLNYNGDDFFLDPGKFNYNNRSPIRKYVTSKNAHSSFQLSKYPYSLNKTNRFDRLIKLDGYNFSEGINMVKGVHGAYSGTDIKLHRAVFQINNKPIVIIYDYNTNNDNKSYEFIQNFNLGEHIVIEEIVDVIKMHGRKANMVIHQLLSPDKPSIIEGDLNVPIAVNTVGFGKATETKQVRYTRNTSEKDVFITAIYDDLVIKNIELVNVDTSINIRIDGKDYHLNI